MRVMQEFRAKHRSEKSRRFALMGALGLAAAAMVATAVSWTNWRHGKGGTPATQVAKVDPGKSSWAEPTAPDGLVIGDTLVASSNTGDFTLLPGSTPSPMEDATVVRVQMQRGALGALGFTVNEEHASDLIQVDLLVGDDGLPQAVRLPESAQ